MDVDALFAIGRAAGETRPEEIAYRSGYISAAQVEQTGSAMRSGGYGAYLLQLLKEKVF